MNNAPDTTLAVALDAREKGIAAIPIVPATKRPLIRWKPYQQALPTVEELHRWFADTRNNVAIITSGMVVFDCEDEATAKLVIVKVGDTPHKVRSPGGGLHLGFRKRMGVVVTNQVQVGGRNFDFRTGTGGLELLPPSETEKGRYAWLEGCGLRAAKDLPLAKVGWARPKRKRKKKSTKIVLPAAEAPGASASHIRDPEAYCLRIESIQGRNGSRGLVRVVCVLRDAGRTAEQAFAWIMSTWNPACAEPEWSAREVLHAIGRHYAKQ